MQYDTCSEINFDAVALFVQKTIKKTIEVPHGK